MTTIVITVDKDIPVPGNTKRRSTHEQYRDKLLAMGIGDSFFLPGKTREDVMFLVRYGKRIGVHLMARDLDEDEIYLEPGVRVWRVEQEDLPGRKPDSTKVDLQVDKASPRHWLQTETATYFKTEAGQPMLESVGVREVSIQEYLEAQRPRYWYHPESDSYFETGVGEAPGDGIDAAYCREVTKEEYDSNTL